MPPHFTYATFLRRLSAGTVDFILTAVVTLSVGWVASQSKLLAIITIPLLCFATLLYEPCLLARFGGTVGKLAVGIRVVSTKGDKIGWSAALMRSSVALAMNAYRFYRVLSGLFTLPPDAFQGQGWTDLFQAIKSSFPPSHETSELIVTAWFCSEFATMLLNRKRRSIHDFLAGTVVVRRTASAASPIQRAA